MKLKYVCLMCCIIAIIQTISDAMLRFNMCHSMMIQVYKIERISEVLLYASMALLFYIMYKKIK
jgi:hypothetical protein